MEEENLKTPSNNLEMCMKEYTPTRMEVLKENEINIRFLSVGCIIKVGCKEIAFANIKEAMMELNKYFENPFEEKKRWYEIFNKQYTINKLKL